MAFQSWNPHTPSSQNFMFSCVWMKHRNGWQGASSPVEWATQKQVTFLLGSRFWEADPQSRLSLLNRNHQIIPPYTHYLQTTRVNITMEAGMKLSGQHPPLPAPAQKAALGLGLGDSLGSKWTLLSAKPPHLLSVSLFIQSSLSQKNPKKAWLPVEWDCEEPASN